MQELNWQVGDIYETDLGKVVRITQVLKYSLSAIEDGYISSGEWNKKGDPLEGIAKSAGKLMKRRSGSIANYD